MASGFGRKETEFTHKGLIKTVTDFFYRLFYIFGLVWETSPFILIALTLSSILQGFLPVIGAMLSKNVINALQLSYGAPESDFSKIALLLVILFAYRFFDSILLRFSHALTRVAGELVIRTTKLKIMNKAKMLDLGSFDDPKFYEKLENASREANNRPIQILAASINLISAVITIVSFVVILSGVSTLAAVIIFVLAIPTALVNFIYRKKTVTYIRKTSKERRQMHYYSELLVNKDMVKEIKLFGLASTFINRFKIAFSKYFNGLKKLIVRETLLHSFISILSVGVNCAFFAYVAYMTFKGELLIGDYTFYTGALTSVATGVSTFVSHTAMVYEGTLFVDCIIDFTKEEQKLKSLTDSSEIPLRGSHSIEFLNVSFKYPGTDKYVLKNISVKIENGETVVVVGLNGAGKTTLIKLLTRLYDPTEGTIYLDGKDLREYDPEEVYKIFGIIFQDFGKYAETVSENIRFGDVYREENNERIKAAAFTSGADDFINNLPDGYDTPLMRIFEQDGIEPSIGQWQKLAIARAFYGDYDILILDEPTASLDAIAEQEVFEQFDALRKDRITVFVSHRLSSATIADKILVLKEGMLVEEGSHKELMAQKGDYYKLFSTQARRYIEDSAEK